MGYKVNKIMLGTQQVRPGKVFEYSYDFRGKSSTNLINDGWTFINGQSAYTYDSNGVSSNNGQVRFNKTIDSNSISNANKILIKSLIYVNTVTSRGSVGTRIADNSNTRFGGIYMGGINSNGNPGYQIYPYSSIQNQTYVLGDIEFVLTLDLINKTATMGNSKGYSTITTTLTDANITEIKTGNKLDITLFPNGSTSVYKLKTASITIE